MVCGTGSQHEIVVWQLSSGCLYLFQLPINALYARKEDFSILLATQDEAD